MKAVGSRLPLSALDNTGDAHRGSCPSAARGRSETARAWPPRPPRRGCMNRASGVSRATTGTLRVAPAAVKPSARIREFRPVPEEVRCVAAHEAGHIVVARALGIRGSKVCIHDSDEGVAGYAMTAPYEVSLS